MSILGFVHASAWAASVNGGPVSCYMREEAQTPGSCQVRLIGAEYLTISP